MGSRSSSRVRRASVRKGGSGSKWGVRAGAEKEDTGTGDGAAEEAGSSQEVKVPAGRHSLRRLSGRSLSCLLQLQEATGIPRLVTAELQSLPLSFHGLPLFFLCVPLLCVSFIRHLPLDLGSTQILQDDLILRT